MTLSLQTDWYIITLAGIAVFISLLFSFRQWKYAVRNRNRIIMMELLRTVVIAMAAFTLMRPEFVLKTTLNSDPEVAVLQDVSGSMNTRDLVTEGPNGKEAVTRSEWANLQLKNKFYKPLEDKFKVSVTSFSVPKKDTGAKDKKQISEDGTDLNYALSDLLAGYKNLRAVILLSDGAWNSGKSPVGASAELRNRGTKVYAVSTGSSDWLPDIEVKKVIAPAFCLSNEKISIPFQIQSRMKTEIRTTVELISEYGIENSKSIILSPGEMLEDSIIWQPKHDGEYRLTLKTPFHSGELISDNNSSSFNILVKKELLQVLLVDTLPRWEYRYLRNALMRDPGVEVHTLLLHPQLGPGGGKGYISAFPTKEELSKYDVIFIGDIGIAANELTKKDAELLEGVVKQQGSGVVFMPGYQGKELSLLDTAIGDMYPVDLDKDRPGGYASGIESRMELSGKGREHFLLMLADTPSMNSYVWRHLPGFFWNAAVKKERPGSTVLALHSGLKCESGRMPLIVTRQYGNGNVLFMGTDSAWRWRKGVEDKYHYRFWGQVVRWMAHKRHIAYDQGIRCFFVPEAPHAKNLVTLYATLHDRSGAPVDNAPVSVSITPENGGTATTFKLHQEKNGWGLYKGSFTPDSSGIYTVNISSPQTGSNIDIKLDVSGEKREKIGEPVSRNTLIEITRITKGKLFTPDELDKLVEQVNALPKQVVIEKRFMLWCQWWWGAIIILMLTIYWIARKINGLT